MLGSTAGREATAVSSPGLTIAPARQMTPSRRAAILPDDAVDRDALAAIPSSTVTHERAAVRVTELVGQGTAWSSTAEERV